MRNLLKTIIPLLIFASITIQAQGSVVTPYDTTGWDPPATYTDWYNLRIFTLLSNPGGGYNKNMREIDSLMYDLVVYIDANNLMIENDTLKFASTIAGDAAFTTTATTDEVSVTGMDSSDVVVVSVREGIPTTNDLLGVTITNGKFTVSRASGGTSGLKYNWIWIKKPGLTP